MKNLSYEIIRRRQKTYVKAYAILCVIILLSMAFYSYTQWEKYVSAKVIVQVNSELLTTLRTRSAEVKADYNQKKADYDAIQHEINKKLGSIFPQEDEYAELTRQLDAFEEQISQKNNPFEVSNISYLTPVKQDHFSILPVRMSIQSSRENFTKFMHLIENSASFEGNTRLMDISSIRLNFQDSGENSEIINFTVQINAYYRK